MQILTNREAPTDHAKLNAGCKKHRLLTQQYQTGIENAYVSVYKLYLA